MSKNSIQSNRTQFFIWLAEFKNNSNGKKKYKAKQVSDRY